MAPHVSSVAKSGSASTVVWNPWQAKAAAMADFGDDEYQGWSVWNPAMSATAKKRWRRAKALLAGGLEQHRWV
jgi:D-hexose-6-phosphate mutarotase